MSSIDKGIELIGNVLNTATVTLWGVETLNGFYSVLSKLRKIKNGILLKNHDSRSSEESQDQMEL